MRLLISFKLPVFSIVGAVMMTPTIGWSLQAATDAKIQAERVEQIAAARKDAFDVTASSLPPVQKQEVEIVLTRLEDLSAERRETAQTEDKVFSSERDGFFIVNIVAVNGSLVAAASRSSSAKAQDLARTALKQCTDSGETIEIIEPNGYREEGVAIALKPTVEAPNAPSTKHT